MLLKSLCVPQALFLYWTLVPKGHFQIGARKEKRENNVAVFLTFQGFLISSLFSNLAPATDVQTGKQADRQPDRQTDHMLLQMLPMTIIITSQLTVEIRQPTPRLQSQHTCTHVAPVHLYTHAHTSFASHTQYSLLLLHMLP